MGISGSGFEGGGYNRFSKKVSFLLTKGGMVSQYLSVRFLLASD